MKNKKRIFLYFTLLFLLVSIAHAQALTSTINSSQTNPSYGPFDIEPGKTVDIYPLVKYAVPGNYYPLFAVDADNIVEESNETNNEVTIPIIIS